MNESEILVNNTASSERFNRIIRITQRHFSTPIVTVNLIENEHLWTASSLGGDLSKVLPAPTFYEYASSRNELTYIPDLLQSEPFCNTPQVIGEPHLRFYAAVPLHNPEGKTIGTLSIFYYQPRTLSTDELALLRDMAGCIEDEFEKAEIRQAAQTLQDQEQRFSALINTIVDGIIVIDAKGLIQTLNPAAITLFGYQAAEVEGQNIKMLMPAPYAEEHDGYLHNYLTTDIKKVIGIGREVTGKRKDNSTFPMELAVSEMEVGGQRMFTGIVRDITERKRAEAEIQARENRIRALVDTIVDGIIVIDANGLIQTLNPAAVTLFGYPLEQVEGHNIKMLMPAPYAEEHDGYLHNYLTTDIKKVIGIGREVTGKRKDGSTFPMELAVSEMEINGERMFTGIVRDITERKNAERVKNEFISTVSHELRTPLTSIRGALGLMLGKFSAELPEKGRHMLEMAERNSQRLTLLINDILDLEKIEAGHLEFDFNEVDLLALAQRALEDNDGFARKHQVHLRLERNVRQAYVRGDEHRLLQVFANLISNAVKYSPAEGVVTISVTAHDKGYRVGVKDHGSGIPPEFHNRIFQRFAQADSSDTREKGGTGLGLSITKAIIERHNGTIDYTTAADTGTEFFFDLPPTEKERFTTNKTKASGRVLICEHDREVAQLLTEMVQREGGMSDIATSAAEGLALLGKHHYLLILLDLELPDNETLQLLQQLEENANTAKVPIIVVSDCTPKHTPAVMKWIQKPATQEHLAQAFQQALPRVMRPNILHMENDPDVVQIVQVLLDGIANVHHVESVPDARQQLAEQLFDLIIIDIELENDSGIELLDELKRGDPVLIFSAQIPPRNITERVTAALTKSVTSNEQLLGTIMKLLGLPGANR